MMVWLKNVLKGMTSRQVMLGVLVSATVVNAIIGVFLLRTVIAIRTDLSSTTSIRRVWPNTIKDHIAAVESSIEAVKETEGQTKEAVGEIKDAVEEIRDHGVKINR